MKQLCAVDLDGDENWEDIPLQGHNQGGGRRETAPGTVNNWLPSEIKWCLLRILADLFPVLDDLEDGESRLMERMDALPWRGYQWPHRDFMLTLRGAADEHDAPANQSALRPPSWLPQTGAHNGQFFCCPQFLL